MRMCSYGTFPDLQAHEFTFLHQSISISQPIPPPRFGGLRFRDAFLTPSSSRKDPSFWLIYSSPSHVRDKDSHSNSHIVQPLRTQSITKNILVLCLFFSRFPFGQLLFLCFVVVLLGKAWCVAAL